MIWCSLDYAQCHLVDFWKKRPANFNFIWLEWNSYNSSIQFHIVWSSTSIFKLKCSLDGGCLISPKVNLPPEFISIWGCNLNFQFVHHSLLRKWVFEWLFARKTSENSDFPLSVYFHFKVSDQTRYKSWFHSKCQRSLEYSLANILQSI